MLIKYSLAWFGLMILAIINGASRDGLYKSRVGDLAAHQISTAVLLILISIYLLLLMSKWPITAASEAWSVGFIWLAMTLAFEFVVGHFVFGASWEKIFHDYNIFAGRVWILIPLWVLIAPYLLSKLKH